MNKIVDIKKAVKLASVVHGRKEKIILVGGCFDILHIGHIRFLEEAKKLGGKLLVLLESDKKVKELKGKNRPVFTQNERTHTLASLLSVDYIVLLPHLKNSDYDKLITLIKPDIIAAAENDPILDKKRRQAEMVSGKLVKLKFFKSLSSSQIAEKFKKENI